METIVYTYKTPKYQILKRTTNQRDWIIRSIESARKVGYTNIELYTDDREFAKGLDIDKVHYISDDYEIWDSFKIWVLENRNDDYFLSDNDVIYYDKIPFENGVDIYFDGYEVLSWDMFYKPTMSYLEKNLIFNTIPIWSYSKRKVINIGILKINNQKLKDDYIRYWKSLYYISKDDIESNNENYINITQIISQYLLTLLVAEFNYIGKNYSGDDWTQHNLYYKHFAGNQKIKNIYPI